jgi:AraC-like DNA-binding protein
MTNGANASGRLMLLSPERIFYAGLLGRPRRRISGGMNIYVAVEGKLTLTGDVVQRTAEVAVAAPYAPHSVTSDDPSIICLVIEPESATPDAMAALATRLDVDAASDFAARIRRTYRMLRECGASRNFSTQEFDRAFLGDVLATRPIDRRIRRAIASLSDITGAKLTAADCAAHAGLSCSRFLHLFKDETGIAFRAFRAWKRARHMLHYVNEDLNLAHLAQEIGYPDSTHFSHSIRRFYGLKPRAIFSGSRDLAIYRCGIAAQSVTHA